MMYHIDMKVVIHTLGCKVNQYESDAIALALEERGIDVSYELEKADAYVVNTCAVTNEAEKKSRQVLAKIQKLNPKAKIYVCGCASQHNPQNFQKGKNVVHISGVANKLKLADAIEKGRGVVELDSLPAEYNDTYVSKPSKTRAYIKIQDGCNNFCSYCLIPYLRGRSRSRNVVEILNEVENLQQFAKEIVLTGIDISDFKIDGKPALGKLLEMLSDYNVRIRLGSLEQGVVNDELLEVILKMKNLCPHFHLSLQSGSATVLKRMNRHYTPEQFLAVVQKIGKCFVNPAITTDVIVGFPGETEEEFMETVNFVKKVKFFQIHVFPYSKREGTVAAKMKDLNGDIKRKRVEILEKINEKLQKKYINKCKKTLHSVLIEEKEGQYYIGHAENYIKCYIKAEKLNLNTFVAVKLKKPYIDGALAVVKNMKK